MVKGNNFCFKLPFSLSDKKAFITSNHFIQHPWDFLLLKLATLLGIKSGLLLHNCAHSLGILLKGVKFRLFLFHLGYDNEYLNGEALLDPNLDGVLGNGAFTTIDESLRAMLRVIQVRSGLFEENEMWIALLQ